MKKIFTFIAIFMIATCLTACSTPDDGVFKPDTNDNSQFEQTDKSDNKKSDTETKKDDSKADDKTSESKPDNKSDNKKPDSNSSSDKPANKPSNGNNGSASKPNSNKPADKPAKPNGNTGSNKPSNDSNKSDSSTSKPSQSTEKPAETKPSQPAHQHTWVDHTATKTVHHDAVYEEVTIPAVTKWQIRCLGCGQYFDTHADLRNHAMKVQMGMESGDPQRCGSCAADAEREVVITPAKTERQLVKDAWDETQTYVDYQYCSGCGQHK